MKKYNILYLIIALVGFSACEKDATNVNIPVVKQQLAVHSYISPQAENIVVWVGLTKPIFGANTGSTPYIDYATVKISDGVTMADVPYNAMYNNYRLDTNTFKIVPGKTYTLYVSTPDGKNAKASCTVPQPHSTGLTVDYDTAVTRTANSLDYQLNVRVKWQDRPGEINYYHAFTEAKIVQHPDTSMWSYSQLSDDLVSDKNNDGKLLSGTYGQHTSSWFNQSGLTFFEQPEGIKYHLLHVDENYYKYHVSAQNNNSDDPFSEPVTMHTNIENGLGCFGAYSQVSGTIDF